MAISKNDKNKQPVITYLSKDNTRYLNVAEETYAYVVNDKIFRIGNGTYIITGSVILNRAEQVLLKLDSDNTDNEFDLALFFEFLPNNDYIANIQQSQNIIKNDTDYIKLDFSIRHHKDIIECIIKENNKHANNVC